MALKTTPWGGLQCHIVIRGYKIKGSQGAIQWALSGTRGLVVVWKWNGNDYSYVTIRRMLLLILTDQIGEFTTNVIIEWYNNRIDIIIRLSYMLFLWYKRSLTIGDGQSGREFNFKETPILNDKIAMYCRCYS